MKTNIKLICFIVLTTCGLITAQSADTIYSEQLIEDIIPEPGTDYQEYNELDELEILRDNPVNINTADIVSLQKVPGLDLNYAQIIIQFREKYGHYFSPGELYSIKEIPKPLIKNILPFITTSDIKNKERNIISGEPTFLKANFRSRSSYNIHENNDSLYINYPGSKLKLFNRLSIKYNTIEFGLITEKDPGEKSYIDFWTSHLTLKDIGPFDIVILGDFRFESGVGLILGQPFGFSKTMNAVNPVKKKERIILPNNSPDENSFYRGAAFSITYNSLQFSGFYSNHFRDASLDSISQYISTLLTSGYHRSVSEINSSNLAHEIKWGIRSGYSFSPSLSAAILFCSSFFNKQLAGTTLYSPKGNRFNDLSFSYDFHTASSIYFSGEVGYDFNSVASLNTLQIAFNKDFLFFSSIRNYPRNFISLSGHSQAEQNGKVQNETGFYNGFKLDTGYGVLNIYYDQFRFPFGGSRFPVSNSGEDFLINYSNSFSDNISITTNYKYEDKDYIVNNSEQIYIGRRLRNDLRFSVRWTLDGDINVKTIVEYNSIRIRQNQLNEQGILLSNSVSANLYNNLKAGCSVSFFRTGSFYSSVYEYDEFINGFVTGRVLYGEGLKLNIYFKYQLLSNLNLSAQYSETYKPKVILINPLYSIVANNFIIQLETGI